jgi:hypothetical protein
VLSIIIEREARLGVPSLKREKIQIIRRTKLPKMGVQED